MSNEKKSLFWNTKYIVSTAIVIALLFSLALFTSFVNFGNSTFQVADGLFLALIALIPGPMMLICGIIYPILFDLVTGSFIFIPCSIIIHLLMFLTIKILQKKVWIYFLLCLSCLMVLFYVPYNYFINLNLSLETAQSIAIRELIIDSIQMGISLIISVILTYVFRRYRFNIYLKQKFIKNDQSLDVER